MSLNKFMGGSKEMKPVSLCLVHMGAKGLELVEAHPKVLPDQVLNSIIFKSMPLGANPGEFSSAQVNKFYFSSYIFKLPLENNRDNIASLVAVYSSLDYDIQVIKQVFSIFVKELETKALLKEEVLKKVLPDLYKGLASGSFRIKVSSVAMISIDIPKTKEKDERKDLDVIAEDLWE